VFPLNLYARVRFLLMHIAHETAGAARTRSSLRPFVLRAEFICKPRANAVARTRSHVVIPGRAKRGPGIHTPRARVSMNDVTAKHHDRGYGFGACAKGRIPE
jgi:hypothetical protein